MFFIKTQSKASVNSVHWNEVSNTLKHCSIVGDLDYPDPPLTNHHLLLLLWQYTTISIALHVLHTFTYPVLGKELVGYPDMEYSFLMVCSMA